MNISLSAVKKAFRLYAHKNVDKATLRHNVTAYCKALQLLGEKHILAKQVQRLATPRSH